MLVALDRVTLNSKFPRVKHGNLEIIFQFRNYVAKIVNYLDKRNDRVDLNKESVRSVVSAYDQIARKRARARARWAGRRHRRWANAPTIENAPGSIRAIHLLIGNVADGRRPSSLPRRHFACSAAAANAVPIEWTTRRLTGVKSNLVGRRQSRTGYYSIFNARMLHNPWPPLLQWRPILMLMIKTTP